MTNRWDSLLAFWWTELMVGVEHDPTWVLAKSQMLAESGGNPFAESDHGAVGLFQLMPGTAKDMGVRDRQNPEQSVKGGIGYLRRMYDIFKKESGMERWKFALGSYNSGSGNIIQAQKLAKVAEYDTTLWRSVEVILPEVTGPDNSAQTIAYVRKIVTHYEAMLGRG